MSPETLARLRRIRERHQLREQFLTGVLAQETSTETSPVDPWAPQFVADATFLLELVSLLLPLVEEQATTIRRAAELLVRLRADGHLMRDRAAS